MIRKPGNSFFYTIILNNQSQMNTCCDMALAKLKKIIFANENYQWLNGFVNRQNCYIQRKQEMSGCSKEKKTEADPHTLGK